MTAMTDATITIGAEPALLTMLRGLAEEQRQCREYLARLVALEEERRESERLMDAIITHAAEEAEPQPLPKWFVKADGTFGVNEPDGTQRPATPNESARIAAAIKPARRDR